MSPEQLEEIETTALIKALLDLEKMQVALLREIEQKKAHGNYPVR